MSTNDRFGDCVNCGYIAHDGPCKGSAVRRHLLTKMIGEFEDTLSEDSKMVLGVAGGIHLRDWGRVVALLATKPEVAKEMANRLRETFKTYPEN